MAKVICILPASYCHGCLQIRYTFISYLCIFRDSHPQPFSLSFFTLCSALAYRGQTGTCSVGRRCGIKICNNGLLWLWLQQFGFGTVGGVILRAPVWRLLCRNPSVQLVANISGTNIVICSWGNLLFQSWIQFCNMLGKIAGKNIS